MLCLFIYFIRIYVRTYVAHTRINFIYWFVYLRIYLFHIYIWVNYNISPTWIKAIWGWFPLLTMIIVRSQWGRYNLPRYIYIYIYISISNSISCSFPPLSPLAAAAELPRPFPQAGHRGGGRRTPCHLGIFHWLVSYLSIHPSIHLSIHPFIHLSILGITISWVELYITSQWF